MKNINNANAEAKTANRFSDCNTIEEVVAKTTRLVDENTDRMCVEWKEEFDKREAIEERLEKLERGEDTDPTEEQACRDALNECPSVDELNRWAQDEQKCGYEDIVDEGIARCEKLGVNADEYLKKINYY